MRAFPFLSLFLFLPFCFHSLQPFLFFLLPQSTGQPETNLWRPQLPSEPSPQTPSISRNLPPAHSSEANPLSVGSHSLPASSPAHLNQITNRPATPYPPQPPRSRPSLPYHSPITNSRSSLSFSLLRRPPAASFTPFPGFWFLGSLPSVHWPPTTPGQISPTYILMATSVHSSFSRS
ncbi:hypothetical protein CRG98_022056 [Punica granatum]|uniref:Uncharacterized protein n=1 Tax=Punica granatum TaxID=22663 RepID=A0A2I0JMS7_PUNGR|nr:hypothetical protein CRG98_022056 [Punica granatum]